jgi:hypothetical protein
MAERKGPDFRRWLFSAERFNDSAIARGDFLNTDFCEVIASLVSVTLADHFLAGFFTVVVLFKPLFLFFHYGLLPASLRFLTPLSTFVHPLHSLNL